MASVVISPTERLLQELVCGQSPSKLRPVVQQRTALALLEHTNPHVRARLFYHLTLTPFSLRLFSDTQWVAGLAVFAFYDEYGNTNCVPLYERGWVRKTRLIVNPPLSPPSFTRIACNGLDPVELTQWSILVNFLPLLTLNQSVQLLQSNPFRWTEDSIYAFLNSPAADMYLLSYAPMHDRWGEAFAGNVYADGKTGKILSLLCRKHFAFREIQTWCAAFHVRNADAVEWLWRPRMENGRRAPIGSVPWNVHVPQAAARAGNLWALEWLTQARVVDANDGIPIGSPTCFESSSPLWVCVESQNTTSIQWAIEWTLRHSESIQAAKHAFEGVLFMWNSYATTNKIDIEIHRSISHALIRIADELTK